MKTILLNTALVIILLLMSCSKESQAVDPGTNSSFSFKSLVAEKTEIPVNAFTKITANAEGSNLTYKWTAEQGTLLGSGTQVSFSICHATETKIICTVSDASGHTDTKDIIITTIEE